jgi:hypothetical protein
LPQFDDDFAEPRCGEVARGVCEVPVERAGVSFLQFQLNGRLALHGVLNLGGIEDNVDVVVSVSVEKRGFVGREIESEGPHGFILQNEVMMGLGGEVNGALRKSDRCEDEWEEQ